MCTTHAWDGGGHRICARIARNIIPTPLLHHFERNVLNASMDEIANELDEFRGRKVGFDMSYYHTLEYDSEPMDSADGLLAYVNDAQIDRDYALFAVHFICDLHQPLHVLPKSRVRASFDTVPWIDGRNVTLHALWDMLPDVRQISHVVYADWLTERITPVTFMTTVERSEMSMWLNGRADAYHRAERFNDILRNCHTKAASSLEARICNMKFVSTTQQLVENSLIYGGLRLVGHVYRTYLNAFIP
ncbi:putative S1/P1 nuclease [Heliothis virescens ascovirus 3f]|uniref:Putative S1/P1 nuclease n=1 Tax=Heliothis virescens ascovirus 3f TaxID=328614 RepID=A0A171PVI1_9VIRU|nr:putative S1/P1 nuclease [Heliothis virescens ascovirus 3f]AJP09055.1 putative S1/P1 nuclease [Heliothis virescens ascovirus 3f]